MPTDTKRKILIASLVGFVIIVLATLIVTAMLRAQTTGGTPVVYNGEQLPTTTPVVPRGVPKTAALVPLNTVGWTLRILGTVQEVHPTSLVVEVRDENDTPEQFNVPIAPTTSVERTYVLSKVLPGGEVYSELRVSSTKTVKLGTKKIPLSDVQAGESVDAEVTLRSGGTWEAARVIVTGATLSL